MTGSAIYTVLKLPTFTFALLAVVIRLDLTTSGAYMTDIQLQATAIKALNSQTFACVPKYDAPVQEHITVGTIDNILSRIQERCHRPQINEIFRTRLWTWRQTRIG
ncbi:hypothetical protein B0H10DRAFT_1943503 [Mycena sp. CBHHK59/15]|nr:hypothetical protein B0H10DRAFT_1943503 [Mycena sp. CBHHK59/15]